MFKQENTDTLRAATQQTHVTNQLFIHRLLQSVTHFPTRLHLRNFQSHFPCRFKKTFAKSLLFFAIASQF